MSLLQQVLPRVYKLLVLLNIVVEWELAAGRSVYWHPGLLA